MKKEDMKKETREEIRRMAAQIKKTRPELAKNLGQTEKELFGILNWYIGSGLPENEAVQELANAVGLSWREFGKF